MNLSIIGLGSWGKKLLVEFSKSNSVISCYNTGNLGNIDWVRQNFPHIRIERNIAGILNNDNVDAVVIASPIKTHKNLVRKSLLKGKHVFVEKPLSESASDSKVLIDLAKKKKRNLFVGNIFLYHPVFQKLKVLLSNEKIKSINGIWLKTGSFKEDILLNLLYHELCIVHELIGTPKKIIINNSQKFASDSDIIDIKIIFTRNVTCYFHIDRISQIRHKSLTIITNKTCYVWEDDNLFQFSKHSLKFIRIFHTKKSALENECKSFINSLSQKPIKFDNAVQSFKVLKTLCKAS